MREIIINDLAYWDFVNSMSVRDFEEEINRLAYVIRDANIGRIIIWKSWASDLVDSQTAVSILQNRQNSIDQVARLLVLTKLGKDPFIEDIIDDYFDSTEIIINASHNSRYSSSLAGAFITKLPLYNLTRDDWMIQSVITDITIESIEDGGELGKSFEYLAKCINHTTKSDTVDGLYREINLGDIDSSEKLLNYLSSYSKLKILPSARRQIHEVFGLTVKNSIVRHLIEIAKWSDSGDVNYQNLELPGSHESKQKLGEKNLMKYRTFLDGNGGYYIFSYHTKMPKGYRIYIQIDDDRVILGYVGPHLPLS